jgi:hypothetical protein
MAMNFAPLDCSCQGEKNLPVSDDFTQQAKETMLRDEKKILQ